VTTAILLVALVVALLGWVFARENWIAAEEEVLRLQRALRAAEDRAWEAALRAEFAEDEARAFLRRTAMSGGSIVSSSAMTAQQIAIARAADRLLVTPDGYGFVYVPGPEDVP
jgi:hypothetical protein